MMDRAQRRQRRLDQKMWRGERGRGRPRRQVPEASNRESVDRPGGPENASEGESTDDVICDGGVGDLQVKLHVCEAEKLKWQKISDERWEKLQMENERRKFAEEKIEKLEEKIKEKDTEIECLNLKIKQITEEKSSRQGQSLAPESLYLKLRGESQVLEEKTKAYRGIIDRLFKGFSSEMEILTVQDAKSKPQSDVHQQASKMASNVGRNAYESASEVHVDDINDHHLGRMQNEHLGRNGYGNVSRMDANGYHQPSKKSAASGRPAHTSAGEVDVDVDVERQRIGHHHQMRREEVHNAVHENGASEEDDFAMPYAPAIADQPEMYGNLRSLDNPADNFYEDLFTSKTREAAKDLVDHHFLKWLNCRVRRPTTKEMSSHKSQLHINRPRVVKDCFYWTGITESSLLEKFAEENGMKRPTSNALTTLLRTVLRIDGIKRTNDMIWCLVWLDCISAEQLPGYVPHSHDSKRGQVSDPEFSPRSVKVRAS